MFVEHTGSEDEDLLSVYYDDAELRLDIHFVLYAGCILLITTLFLLTYEISFHYYVHTYFIWQILYINLTIYFLHGKS